MEIFVFRVITFETIETYTSKAPQNDCLNVSFVKYTHGQNGLKMAFYESVLFQNRVYSNKPSL